MSGKRSSSPGDDVPREETGWLDDLRKAKKGGDDLDRSDFTNGGTDRWAKLSALGDHDSPPAEPRPPRESAPRRNRAEGEPGGRRRAAEAESMETRRARMEAAAANLIGRRSRPEPEPEIPDAQKLVGRRARPEPEPDPQQLVGRRARPEPEPDASKLVGRRARPEPEPEIPDAQKLVGRRARPEPEPESQKLVGRRARKDPEQDALFDRPASSEPRRRSAFSDPDPISPAPSARGGHRSDPLDEPSTSGRGRRSDPVDEPPRRRSPFGNRSGSNAPVSSPPSDEPRRRSTFGDRSSSGVPEETRRRSPFGLRPSLGTPVPAPSVEETRRRTPFGDRPVPNIPITPPIEEPRRRAPASPPPSDEPRRRSPFAPGTPSRPSALKPPLNAEPEPIGPARPLRGAGLALGSVMGGGAAPPGAPPILPIPSGPPAPVRPHSPAGPPPPPAAGHGPRGGLAAGVQAIRGARSEVRRQLREQQRLRMWTLIALVVAVVGALPFFFVLRAATGDPVITSLDALTVPEWAVVNKSDNITGSRWCLLDCRYRERTAESTKPIPDTAQVYRDALTGAGWLPMTGVPGCEPSETPEQTDHSCWRRDEFTLDLTVSEPACKLDGGGRRGFDITPTPTPEASGAAGETPSPPAASECGGSVVHIKVFNAIDDIRLRWSPEPTLDPELENLTDEDLNPTVSPAVSPSP